MNMMTGDMMAQAEVLISGAFSDSLPSMGAVRPTPPNWMIAPVFRPQATHTPLLVAETQASYEAAHNAPYRSPREAPRGA